MYAKLVCSECADWSMVFLSANNLICAFFSIYWLEAHEDAALALCVCVCVFRLIFNWWISQQWRSAVDIYKKRLH